MMKVSDIFQPSFAKCGPITEEARKSSAREITGIGGAVATSKPSSSGKRRQRAARTRERAPDDRLRAVFAPDVPVIHALLSFRRGNGQLPKKIARDGARQNGA
jgi:hypothetical protein